MRKAMLVMGMLSAMLQGGHAFAGEARNPRQGDEISIASDGPAAEQVVIETMAVAVKETETKAQLSKFGEVYAFSPAFFAVYRDRPVRIALWNLQPDDRHDFTLVGPDSKVLATTMLAPLAKKSMVITFHREGLYRFRCNMHQPEMAGQILVLPPPRRD